MVKRISSREEVIAHFDLARDPKGNGWFRMLCHNSKTCCPCGKRRCQHSYSTTFLHLFIRNPVDCWHRVSSPMTYSFLAGAPLLLQTADESGHQKSSIIDNDFSLNHDPVALIGENQWQKLSSTGDWSLVSGTICPGFELEKLEVAVEGWQPGQGEPKLSFPGEKWTPPDLEGAPNKRG